MGLRAEVDCSKALEILVSADATCARALEVGAVVGVELNSFQR